MDARLTELQLSPGQVVDDLMAYFRGSEGGDFARNLLDSVRSNPLPAALTGIGLTNTHQPRAASDGDTWESPEELDRTISAAERDLVRQAGEEEIAYHERLNEARGRALGVARQSEDTNDSFTSRVQDALTAAKQSLT
jgi:hypothetical protein